MASRQFHLSEEEIEAVRQRERETDDPQELKRLQAVRAYGTQVPIQQITQVIGCSQDMVREWSQRYTKGGLEGMRSQWATQNAAKLTVEQKAEIKRRLHEHQPDDLLSTEVRINQGAFWTVSDLQVAVKQWYGVVYQSEGTYRRLFHHCGFSYQRTEAVYRSQADEQKRAEFEQNLEKKSRDF